MPRDSSSLLSVLPLVGTFVSGISYLYDHQADSKIGYTMAISAPTEITAAATIVEFWHPSVNPAVWMTVFGVFITGLNFCNVRFYGEVSVREEWKNGELPGS